MTRSYFGWMLACMLVSASLMAAATFFRFPPWAIMAGGVGPMCFYHLFYLRPRAKTGLHQAAIDSVYYFGFLVTVSALAISAIAIAIAGDNPGDNVNTVLYQFGAGLLATGYAVVARMHLSSIASATEDHSLEENLGRYIQRSAELVTNAEMVSEQFVEFSRRMMTVTAEVAEQARLGTEKAMLETARVFESEMRSTLAAARDGWVQMRALVNDATFASEREQLARGIKTTTKAAEELHDAMKKLAGMMNEEVQAAQQAIATSTGLEQTLRRFSLQVEGLCGNDGPLLRSSVSLRTAVTGLSEIAAAVAGAGPAFMNMQALTAEAAEQLQTLAGASEKLDLALTRMAEAADISQSLAGGMSKVSSALSPLAANAKLFSTNLERAGHVSEKFEQQLRILPEQAQRLSSYMPDPSKATEGTDKLAAAVDKLQATVASLRQLYSGLADSVLAMPRAHSHTPADKFYGPPGKDVAETDAKRSGHAASPPDNRLI